MALKKLGGLISLAGGCVGIVASVFTLIMGGMGSAFEIGVAAAFLTQGWVLLLSSMLSTIFGPLATVGRAKIPGLVIAVACLMGIIMGEVLGGNLVARVLIVPMAGGILAFLGDRGMEAEAPALA